MFINRITYPKNALHYVFDGRGWSNQSTEIKCSEMSKKTTRVYNPLNGLLAHEEMFTIETPTNLDYKPNDRIIFEGKTYSIDESSYRELYDQKNHTFKNDSMRVYELRLKRA